MRIKYSEARYRSAGRGYYDNGSRRICDRQWDIICNTVCDRGTVLMMEWEIVRDNAAYLYSEKLKLI